MQTEVVGPLTEQAIAEVKDYLAMLTKRIPT